MKLNIGWLYPQHLNIYADRGNLLLLKRRCEWRGIDFEVRNLGLADQVDPKWANMLYLGGGQDRDQALCAQDIATVKRKALHEYANDGGLVLAVCGGYQLLGHEYESSDGNLPGAGIVDLTTTAGNSRLIGNCMIEVQLPGMKNPQVLAGFENHAGRTHLGNGVNPLGSVSSGFGNDGNSGFEGAVVNNVIGTYLHGPLLPKNVWFADWLIARALGIEVSDLNPLDDEIEELAHHEAITACRKGK